MRYNVHVTRIQISWQLQFELTGDRGTKMTVRHNREKVAAVIYCKNRVVTGKSERRRGIFWK